MSRILFIFDILMRVPPSAVPQGEVEWFDPTARTGAGYCDGFLRIETISSRVAVSTTTAGWETMLPNQLVTVAGICRLFYPDLIENGMGEVPHHALRCGRTFGRY